jgi:hypothetical protein
LWGGRCSRLWDWQYVANAQNEDNGHYHGSETATATNNNNLDFLPMFTTLNRDLSLSNIFHLASYASFMELVLSSLRPRNRSDTPSDL